MKIMFRPISAFISFLLLFNVSNANYSQPNYDNEMNFLKIIKVARKDIKTEYAVVVALDKVTATVEKYQVKVGESFYYKGITVKVNSCLISPPDKTPESAMFVVINDINEKDPVFSGWMFKSSPSINPFEHPVYDVWLVDCKNS